MNPTAAAIVEDDHDTPGTRPFLVLESLPLLIWRNRATIK
jgi:hypothetical protein